jgi:hypothetical protein
MKKLLLLLTVLIMGGLFWVGCGGSDDTEAVAPAPAPAATNAPVAPDANAVFAAITPSGLALTDKYTISGRGTVYSLKCSAIDRAASYTFTTSFGASETVAVPTISFQHSGPDVAFTFSVYASNADGFNTRTASANVN